MKAELVNNGIDAVAWPVYLKFVSTNVVTLETTKLQSTAIGGTSGEFAGKAIIITSAKYTVGNALNVLEYVKIDGHRIFANTVANTGFVWDGTVNTDNDVWNPLVANIFGRPILCRNLIQMKKSSTTAASDVLELWGYAVDLELV